MARIKLTTGHIRDFITDNGQAFLWDADTPGLAVRATAPGRRKPEGSKAYIFQGILANGQEPRITIGDVRAWSIEGRFIKGQKYTLLSHRENLSMDGRRALKTLLAANKRLNTAYLLKESFVQIWSYQSEGWARRFFDNWRANLKWQRLKPYEKFTEMIDRHWVSLSFR